MAFYTRNQWCGFIDISETSTPTWARVRLSEKLELDEGTKTESYNFVDSDSETTTIWFPSQVETVRFSNPRSTSIFMTLARSNFFVSENPPANKVKRQLNNTTIIKILFFIFFSLVKTLVFYNYSILILIYNEI